MYGSASHGGDKRTLHVMPALLLLLLQFGVYHLALHHVVPRTTM
jgi:hypothetical protein